MKIKYKVVITKDEDGLFVAEIPELPGCHTQAKDLDSLMSRVQEAIELYLEVNSDQLGLIDFVGVEEVSVA